MEQRQLVTVARVTGVCYLAMAISGILGFMVFQPQIFVEGDLQKTLTNLTTLGSIARIRLCLEFMIIISQALTAVWFYRLFKDINAWAAWAVGIWGIVNSVVIMVSAIAMSSAIAIATSITIAHQDQILLLQLLTSLINNAWGVGGLFFGLWLIPMGFIVVNSKRMPVGLGRILMIGGVGYLISTFINYTGVENDLVDILVIPATIGEFWMIGYLLIYGIRPATTNEK